LQSFSKPPWLRNHLTNYKKITHDQQTTAEDCSSAPCGHCALCGNHGKQHSMVEKESYICTPTGRIKLTHPLDCAIHWYLRGHRFTLQITIRGTNDEGVCSSEQTWQKYTGKEEATLIEQFIMKHPDIRNNLPLLSDCYKVTFVEQPP